MRTHQTLVLALTLAAAPFALAHDADVGAPKTRCETTPDRHLHEYGQSTGFILGFGLDGSTSPCPGADPSWDGHYEFAFGGAFLLACDAACGIGGWGKGATHCYGTPPDHHPRTPIRVVDAALSAAGQPVHFFVSADMGPNCGDFDADIAIDCVDVCTPPFDAGADGSYQVYVTGTTGHVLN